MQSTTKAAPGKPCPSSGLQMSRFPKVSLEKCGRNASASVCACVCVYVCECVCVCVCVCVCMHAASATWAASHLSTWMTSFLIELTSTY